MLRNRFGWKTKERVFAVHLNTSLDVCIERVAGRTGHPSLNGSSHDVENVVRRLHGQFTEIQCRKEGIHRAVTVVSSADVDAVVAWLNGVAVVTRWRRGHCRHWLCHAVSVASVAHGRIRLFQWLKRGTVVQRPRHATQCMTACNSTANIFPVGMLMWCASGRHTRQSQHWCWARAPVMAACVLPLAARGG